MERNHFVHHREEVLKKDSTNRSEWRVVEASGWIFTNSSTLLWWMCHPCFLFAYPLPKFKHRQVSFPKGQQSSNHSFSGAMLNLGGVCLGIFLPNLWFVSVSRSVGFFKRVRDVCERWRENQLVLVGRVPPCFTFKKKRVPCVASQDFVFLLYLSWISAVIDSLFLVGHLYFSP